MNVYIHTSKPETSEWTSESWASTPSYIKCTLKFFREFWQHLNSLQEHPWWNWGGSEALEGVITGIIGTAFLQVESLYVDVYEQRKSHEIEAVLKFTLQEKYRLHFSCCIRTDLFIINSHDHLQRRFYIVLKMVFVQKNDGILWFCIDIILCILYMDSVKVISFISIANK